MQHKRKRRFREEVRERVEKSSAKLIAAARHGDLKTVCGMLEASDVTIDAMDRLSGETAFSAALACGHRDVCEYLLLHGAHLFAPCIVGGRTQSTLVKAVNDGDVGFVRQLVAHGVMLAVPEMDPLTCPLAEAVKISSIEMLTVLQDIGARASPHQHGIDFPEPAGIVFRFVAWNTHMFTPWWLLAIAVWHQDTRIIDHLFKTYDVLNDRETMEEQGGRPLFLAVYRENEEIATDLIDRGASTNQVLKWSLTPMVAAVAVNSVKMLRFLLDRGGDVNATHKSIDVDSGVYEGLLATAIHFRSMDCAHELLRIETRPEHQDRALAMAIKHGDVEFVQLMLDIALPSTPEAFQMCASRASCPFMLDLLLTRCCAAQYPVSALDACYKEASRDRNVDLASVLIAHGFDVTTKTKEEQATDVEWQARRNSM